MSQELHFTWWERWKMRQHWLYRLEHWLFKWKRDDEGDIAFVLFNWIAFVKYKEHTIIKFNGYKLERAYKYQGYRPRKEEDY